MEITEAKHKHESPVTFKYTGVVLDEEVLNNPKVRQNKIYNSANVTKTLQTMHSPLDCLSFHSR